MHVCVLILLQTIQPLKENNNIDKCSTERNAMYVCDDVYGMAIGIFYRERHMEELRCAARV